MLKVSNMAGFGGGGGPLKYTYVGRYNLGTASSGSQDITLPAGTQSVVLCAYTSVNASLFDDITSMTFGGVEMNTVVWVRRFDEYNCPTWIKNINIGSGTKTLSWTKTYNGTYGLGVYIYSLNKPFITYAANSTDTDSDASDPLDCNVDFYKGGFAVAHWVSKFGAASVSGGELVADYLVTNDGCAASCIPTADVTQQSIIMEDGSGGNDGQTASAASWHPTKFA